MYCNFRLEHWDVNNENLHAHPFEDLTHDPHITQKMFDWIHALEPNNKLFLNEYNVITSGDTTTVCFNFFTRKKSRKRLPSNFYFFHIQLKETKGRGYIFFMTH